MDHLLAKLNHMSPELRQYTLVSLAQHLHEAGYYQQLASLFCDDSWMRGRFEGNGYTYDGYLADLSLAWQQARIITQRQIEANQEPESLPECLRYTLIFSSINSLTSNYSPAVVAQAVKERLWNPERSMSVAKKILDPVPRARMYLALLKTNRLSQHDQEEAQRQVLAAALAIEDERDRAEVLRALVPQLTSPLLEQALAATLALEDVWDRAQVLGALAPQVAKSRRPHVLEQALAAALAIEKEKDRAQALRMLAPQLTGPLFAEAAETVLAIQSFLLWAYTLAGFLPAITEHPWLLRRIRQVLLYIFSPIQPLSRKQVLHTLNTTLFRPPILSPNTLDTMALYLVEIFQKWQWL